MIALKLLIGAVWLAYMVVVAVLAERHDDITPNAKENDRDHAA